MNAPRRKLTFLLCLALLAAWPALCIAGSSAKGTSAAAFLTLGVDARAAALGDAMSAAADDASAIYWNPAALTQVRRHSATFMHAVYIESSYYDFGAYAQTLGENGALGVAVQRLSAGDIKRRDSDGADVGTLSPSDQALVLGYAHRWGPWSLGANVKAVQSKILDDSQTVAVDGGLLLTAGQWKTALTVNHLGGKMQFDNASEPLPLTLRAGVAWNPSQSWQWSADAVVPRDSDIYGATGLEWRAVKTQSFAADLRAGYNSRTAGDVGGMTGFTFGAGFTLQSVSVDYAFVPMGDLGQAHRMSFSVNF